MTLAEVMHKVETSRLQGGQLLEVLEHTKVTIAIVNEYDQYLQRYHFPEAFWIWLLGGENRKGEQYPLGALVREITEDELSRRLSEFSHQMKEQVVEQHELHKKAPFIIPSPVRWAQFFIGFNGPQAGQLRKETRGLWACRSLYRRYKDYARHADSEWAQAQLSGQGSLLQMEEPMHWPPDPRFCFVWRRLPMWRPWLLDLSPTRRDQLEEEPGIRALEVRAIGYMGKVVANSAELIRKSED